MRVSVPVIGLGALLLVSDVSAGRQPPPPAAEMLEFLGTYETAGGAVVDPMEVTGDCRGEKAAVKAGAKGKKAVKAKNKGKGRRL